MSTLSDAILSAARERPEGTLVSPREFLHLGSRAAVDQAFSRLARKGALLRLGRGAYALAVRGRFGLRAPGVSAVLEALRTTHGEVIVPSGAAEANLLGLSTQVPGREIYLSSGPSRVYRLGRLRLELRHASHWLLALGDRPAGKAIRALAWLGEAHAGTALKALRTRLDRREWQALQESRATLPGWMARAIAEAQQ
ncbi:DUF6088 family protein [Thioalkalivibrio thiocyanodenitrificans]|uniref:DUF6088 family protein n=1 Tax=Thioalkalivibrio thiocyanodenitrificans TaxID=243063 RepID=UPI000362CE5F|nr:DUF6088 family protein [Thioalkalivibrio thiocyanodenitrificans]